MLMLPLSLCALGLVDLDEGSFSRMKLELQFKWVRREGVYLQEEGMKVSIETVKVICKWPIWEKVVLSSSFAFPLALSHSLTRSQRKQIGSWPNSWPKRTSGTNSNSSNKSKENSKHTFNLNRLTCFFSERLIRKKEEWKVEMKQREGEWESESENSPPLLTAPQSLMLSQFEFSMLFHWCWPLVDLENRDTCSECTAICVVMIPEDPVKIYLDQHEHHWRRRNDHSYLHWHRPVAVVDQVITQLLTCCVSHCLFIIINFVPFFGIFGSLLHARGEIWDANFAASGAGETTSVSCGFCTWSFLLNNAFLKGGSCSRSQLCKHDGRCGAEIYTQTSHLALSYLLMPRECELERSRRPRLHKHKFKLVNRGEEEGKKLLPSLEVLFLELSTIL